MGALELGDLAVSIRPKLEVSRVLFLASYAMGAFRLQDEPYAFEDKATLVEALAPALVAAARRAFGRGLLQGYRTEEEALHTVRGRIMVCGADPSPVSTSPSRWKFATTNSPTTSSLTAS